MTVDKSLLAGSTTMLVLKLLDGQDMYGYQMIEELSRRSERAFALKTGTLYPLLHSLEEKELIRSYEKDEARRARAATTTTATSSLKTTTAPRQRLVAAAV